MAKNQNAILKQMTSFKNFLGFFSSNYSIPHGKRVFIDKVKRTMKIKLTSKQIVMLIRKGIVKDYPLQLNKKSAEILVSYLKQNNIDL